MPVSQLSHAELRSHVLASMGSTYAAFANFVVAYFEASDPQELQQRGVTTLTALASAHWRLLEASPDVTGARVRVFNPSLAEDGFVSEHTIIQIVHDDMPFLVDSVTMSVNRSGRMARWIVHPLLAVERDSQSRVLQAWPALRNKGNTIPVTSLILLECERILSEPERQAMAADILQVLSSVRLAVQDWRSMLQRLHFAIDACESLALPAFAKAESVAFLHWLEENGRESFSRSVNTQRSVSSLASSGVSGSDSASTSCSKRQCRNTTSCSVQSMDSAPAWATSSSSVGTSSNESQ